MTKVFTSSVIDAPVGKVWHHIRDFNSLPKWMPVVKDSHIEADLQLNFTYSILESPMAVKNYTATVELRKVTDGDRTYIKWIAEFDSTPEEEAGLIELIGTGVFKGGLDSLKKHFSEK